MFEKEYHIGSNDVDQFLDLKISSLFKIFQDIATEHAEKLDIGKRQTIDKGLYWVITRVEIEIVKTPKYLQDVIVCSYPGDDMKFIFPRYFFIKDKNGELLIKASSTWMVLNKDTHRISLNPFDGKTLPPEHYEGELHLPNKCNSDEVTFVEQRQVRYSDIDLNGHLNNTKYIEYILDMHNSDFYKKNRIKHFLINYEKELMDGENITLSSNHKNPEFIKGESEDKITFTVNISYEERK